MGKIGLRVQMHCSGWRTARTQGFLRTGQSPSSAERGWVTAVLSATEMPEDPILLLAALGKQMGMRGREGRAHSQRTSSQGLCAIFQ